MSKKKINKFTEDQVKSIMNEIKKKYKPDFFSFRKIGGWDLNPNEIEISFGWTLEEEQK